MPCSKGDWSPFETAPPELGKSVSVETPTAWWGWASARKWGVGPCPAQCIWQGSGFAADQTNAMLAVGGTSYISLVSAAAADENSLTPLHRLHPTETASLGFGGSPVGGGDKTPVLHFFDTSVRGRYHYPRRVLHAVETLGAQGTRWLNKLLVVYSLPVGSASAHSGSHGETRSVFTA